MNTFHVSANLVDRLGWVLVHSAWQFALVALAALVLMRVARRCSAASRYAMLLLALAAMVASPAVTLIVMPADEPMALATGDEQAQASDARQGIAAAGAETDVARSRTRESSDGSLATSATTPVGASESPADSWRTAVDQAVRPWLSVIVGIWCLGVLTFAWRPLLSWHTVRRLRRVGVSPVPAAVAAMLRQTSERLRLRQTVQILQSTLTRVPVVIGYLRPVILLPVSVIAGVPTSQLEAILAHELAHVRRHDFLVNLLQTLIETLFFYHPAVWWLSHRIRVERENCCDDLAVSVLGNRVEYGRALLAIEELRGTTTALALGIRGGSLLDRVQRLFRRDPAERAVGAIGILGVGLLAIMILAVGVWTSTQADDEGATPGAIAELDGGIQVKLVGVSYQPSEKQPWWTPDGSALPGDPLASRWKPGKTRVHDEGEHRELALEISGAEQDVHAWVDFAPGDKLGVWSTFWNFQDDEQTKKKVTLIRAVSAGFPKDQKQRDILVRLAVAPWQQYPVIDLKREKPEWYADGSVQLRRVQERTDGNTQVDLAFPANFELRAQHEVVGEDLDGNEVAQSGVTLADAGARGLIFGCPLDRLAKVRVRFRWYTHEVTFRDVSLHPGHATKVKAKVTKLAPPPDASLDVDVVAQIADSPYTRPTADDQRATATIPAEAWGKPVNGLRLAIVLRSPPIDKDVRLCYDIVAENVSDHDIRFGAEVGIDTWHFFFKAKLTDAGGKQVEQQRGFQTYLGPRLVRFWLKPKERSVISSWATKLLKLDDEGKPLASPEEYRGSMSLFSVKPGRYSLSAAVDLGPGWNSVDPTSGKRTVLSPAKGEWSGKLQTGAVPVALFTEPAPADEAAKPTRVTFVIAQHVIMHDGKIVTWEEVDKILDEAAKAGKIYPQFYSTNGGLPREEELRGPRSQLYKRLYDAGKIDGMSVGSLSPRIGEHLDRIKTPADLVPDESKKQAGRVLDVGGQPLADVEVFPLPAEHVNGVYLRDGRNRNPLEERITRSDRAGKVVIYPEPGETLIAAVHPNGFAITTLAEFQEQMGRLQLQPWARVTGQRPAEGDDAKQSVDFTCYPVPGLSFHIYETEIAEDGRFDQKFVPPGKVIVSRSLSTGQGGSMSFPVETIDLSPGQSHKVPLGPIPDDAKAAIEDAEARRKQAEPKPKPADQSTDTTQPAPAEEAVAKQSIVPAPPIESRQADAAARHALLAAERDKHKHSPLELRIAVSEADRKADGVAWFPIDIIGQRKPVPADESGANLPVQEQLDDQWRGLLWDKAEHALLAGGTWRVVKCEVAPSAQSTDLAPNFEIRITVDAAGGESLRRLTRSHINERLAIVVEGTIISTPVVTEEFGEDFVITGLFSKAAAEKLAAAIRKPDPRKKLASDELPRTIFVLRFAEAKSALAALKAEADIREIRGFEATIDQRLNSVLIIADADTLKILQEILGRLDTPVGPSKPESDALSKLAGVWIAEKVTSSDEVVPKEKFPFELHFENDKLIFRFVAPSLGKDRVHEIVVDETKTPATIDMTREIRGKKETVYAIFRLEGDRLWIHSFRDGNGQPSEKRPTTFDSSKEERSDLLVLTRKPVLTK